MSSGKQLFPLMVSGQVQENGGKEAAALLQRNVSTLFKGLHQNKGHGAIYSFIQICELLSQVFLVPTGLDPSA